MIHQLCLYHKPPHLFHVSYRRQCVPEECQLTLLLELDMDILFQKERQVFDFTFFPYG